MLDEKEAKRLMAEYSLEVALEFMEDFLMSPVPSICAKTEWVDAAWTLVSYARYGDQKGAADVSR